MLCLWFVITTIVFVRHLEFENNNNFLSIQTLVYDILKIITPSMTRKYRLKKCKESINLIKYLDDFLKIRYNYLVL